MSRFRSVPTQYLDRSRLIILPPTLAAAIGLVRSGLRVDVLSVDVTAFRALTREGDMAQVEREGVLAVELGGYIDQ